MKRSLISCFFLFSIITANAQLKPLTFSMAVKADKISPKDLYKRGKFWFSDIFQCSNKKLTLDDANNGVVVGKCSFPYNPKVVTWSAKTKGDVEYQVRLRFKEGRYECEITDFRHKGSGIAFDLITQEASCNKEIAGASSEWKNQVWNDIKSQAKAHANTITKSLISQISQPGSN